MNALYRSLEIDHISQVWQSDITYYEINSIFYYITFIMDSFTRRILGYNASKRLAAEQTTLPSIQMAINKDLQKEVDRSVYLYNNEKPHIKLQRKTPVEFENSYICTGQRADGDKSATELKTQLRNK